jgi:hypothetical protein
MDAVSGADGAEQIQNLGRKLLGRESELKLDTSGKMGWGFFGVGIAASRRVLPIFA